MTNVRSRPVYNIVNHPNHPDGYPVVSSITQEMFNNAVNFKPDPGDIFVVSYPKCGTTWMLNILHLMRNSGVPIQKGDVIDNHAPFLEFVGGVVPPQNWPKRLIKTHLYYGLTPRSSEAKYIFVGK